MTKFKSIFEKKIKRLDTPDGKRFYYHIDNPSKFYKSVTGFSNAVLPNNERLTDWRINVAVALGSKEEQEEYVGMTAFYGTTLDEIIDLMWEGAIINDSIIQEVLVTNMQTKRYSIEPNFVERMSKNLKRDVMSIAQWAIDYKFEPVLVQEMIIIDELLGGTIDFAGYITVREKGFWGEKYKSGVNKGKDKETYKDKRIFVLIDLKSGKNFYPSHELQLVLYKRGLEQHYEELPPIEGIYNLAPKKWKGDSPTYTFKDQSNTIEADCIDAYYHIAKTHNFFNFNPKYIEIHDVSLKNGINVSQYNLEEYINRWKVKK